VPEERRRATFLLDLRTPVARLSTKEHGFAFNALASEMLSAERNLYEALAAQFVMQRAAAGETAPSRTPIPS
jgi:hypothetical protein